MNQSPRACILSIAGPVLTASEAAFLCDAQPWGIILMGRSCISRRQIRTLVDGIWGALGRPCLIFIDQEGGRVARLKAPEWPLFPAAARYGELYEQDAAEGLRATELGHRLMALELSSLGIHADCAPVLDVPVEGAHNIIGDRAFAAQASAIAALGKAALTGLARGGVAGVIKHIPGHGRALVDSHKDLPKVTAGENELGTDFAPFEALADATMAMTAHIAYTAIDGTTPATHSKLIIEGVIRRRIGFDGLLMTDDLGMQALGGALKERASLAIEAGCDICLHCAFQAMTQSEMLQEMETVAEACPPLEGAALRRAQRAEAAAGRIEPFDIEAGWAAFRSDFPSLFETERASA